MHAQRWLGIASFCWLGLAGVGSAQEISHVDDAKGLIPAALGWESKWEGQLGAAEQRSGVRLLVQFHATSPSEKEDAKPGAYMHGLATKLGVAKTGVLAVWFADEKEWRVWVGDGLASKFAGKSGTAEELTASGAMHAAKEIFLALVEKLTRRRLADASSSLPAGQSLTTAQELGLRGDAMVTGLLAKFAPQYQEAGPDS